MNKDNDGLSLRWPVIACLLSLACLASCGGLSTRGGMRSVDYAPDGSLVVFLEGESKILDGDGKTMLRAVPTHHQGGGLEPLWRRYALSANGAVAAAGAAGVVDLFAPSTGKPIGTVEDLGSVATLALSPAGDELAVLTSTTQAGNFPSDPGRLRIFRVSDQGLLAEIAHDPSRVSPDLARRGVVYWALALGFSPDGQTLYGAECAGSDDFACYVDAWNVADGTRVWEYVLVGDDGTPGSYLRALAVAPDGATVAAGDSVGSVAVLGAVDGTPQRRFAAGVVIDGQQPTAPSRLAFSADGAQLVITSSPFAPSPVLRDADGTLVRAWPAENPGGDTSCQSAVLSPDGSRVAASCDPWVKVWNTNGDLITQRRFEYEL